MRKHTMWKEEKLCEYPTKYKREDLFNADDTAFLLAAARKDIYFQG